MQRYRGAVKQTYREIDRGINRDRIRDRDAWTDTDTETDRSRNGKR